MSRIFQLAIVLLSPIILQAQDGQFVEMQNPEILKKGLVSLSENTSTIQSKFVQEKHMQLLTRGIVSQGSIVFKKPDKLRWEYVEPFQYLIILDGGKIHVKNDGKTSTFDMATSKLFAEINNLIINTVKGNVLDEVKFDIEYFQSTTQYLVRMYTKDKTMKEFVSHLEINFNKSDFTVGQIKLVEPNEDYTFIKFTNSIYNEPVDDNSFNFN